MTLQALQVTKTARLGDPGEETMQQRGDARKRLDDKIQKLVNKINTAYTHKRVETVLQLPVLYSAATNLSVTKLSKSQESKIDEFMKEFNDEGEKIFSLLEHIATACDELDDALDAALQSRRATINGIKDIAAKNESLLEEYHKRQTAAGTTALMGGFGTILGAIAAPFTLSMSLAVSEASLALSGEAIAYQLSDFIRYEINNSNLGTKANEAMEQDQRCTNNVTTKENALNKLVSEYDKQKVQHEHPFMFLCAAPAVTFAVADIAIGTIGFAITIGERTYLHNLWNSPEPQDIAELHMKVAELQGKLNKLYNMKETFRSKQVCHCESCIQ